MLTMTSGLSPYDGPYREDDETKIRAQRIEAPPRMMGAYAFVPGDTPAFWERSMFSMSRTLFAVLCLGVVFRAPAGWTQEKKPADALDGPPFVTAKAWAVADGKTGELLSGSQEFTPR